MKLITWFDFDAKIRQIRQVAHRHICRTRRHARSARCQTEHWPARHVLRQRGRRVILCHPEKELIYPQVWPTRQSARTAIFAFIEGWYNRVRLHSTLDYSSPQLYEEDYYRLSAEA